MEILLKSAGPALNKALSMIKFRVNFPIRLKKYDNMGQGLEALDYIPAESIILEVKDVVPSHILAHVESNKAPLVDEVLKYVASLHPDRPFLLQRTRLAHQMSAIQRNRLDPMHDFVETFPLQNLTLPFYWMSAASTYSINMRNTVAQELKNMRHSYDKIFEFERGKNSNISFEEFMWNHAMVWSRAIDLDDYWCLAPLFDLLNHDFDANCEVKKDDVSLKLIASKDIHPKSQLLRNYGEFDNYTYLMRWGFVPENNPYNGFYIAPDCIDDWDKAMNVGKLYDKTPITELENPNNLSIHTLKKQLLAKWGIEQINRGVLPAKPPATKLEIGFRIFFVTMKDAIEKGIKSVEELLEIDYTKPFSKKNERNMSVMFTKVTSYHQRFQPSDIQGETKEGRRVEEIEHEILETHYDYYQSLLK